MPKKKRHSPPQTTSKTPQHVVDRLLEADDLMERGDWVAARELLEPLNQHYPQRLDILTSLSNIYYELRDQEGYLDTAEQLVKLAPRDPAIALMQAGAYLVNFMPARALQAFRRIQERWPDHERADMVRETIADLAAQAELYLAERNRDAARTWLDMWSNVEPENPAIDELRARVERPSMRERLFGGRT